MRFKCGTADPPWAPADQLPGPGRGSSKHFPTMTVDELAAMPWEKTATFEFPRFADDAIMFLWRLSSMQDDAQYVLQQWDFKIKSELVWFKHRPCKECDGVGRVSAQGFPFQHGRTTECRVCDGTGCGTPWFGMGRYTRAQHETCLIATRGKMASKIKDHSIPSVLLAPVPMKEGRAIHSAKPPRFYTDIVQKLVSGPYVELFGRAQRKGWTVLGNEARAGRGSALRRRKAA